MEAAPNMPRKVNVSGNFIPSPRVALICLALLNGLHVCVADDWDHSIVLEKNGKFVVHWTVEGEIVRFKVEAATQGYVGFGLSKTGGMAGSDIVTGWIDNGVISFQDRHGLGNFMPVIDDSQDWELMTGNKNGTHTVLTLRRKLNTCDKEHDIAIDESTIRLIYAYSEEVPKSADQLQYHHGRRGSKSVMLLQPSAKDTLSNEGLLAWDALSPNFTLTSEMLTMYWCKVVKGPTLNKKHHIVKIEPVIQPGNEAYVHHIVMYECITSLDEPDQYEPLVDHDGHQCYHPNMPDTMKKCEGVFAAWGVGGESVVFPDHVGLPLNPSPPKYYMLEIHYDNPSAQNNVRDQSGLRLWYTPELRKHDAGTLMIGGAVSARMIIPPGVDSYVVSGHGQPECFAPAMPPEGINILGVFLHSHLLGTRLSTRHFRGKKELRPIAKNENYDFNYQEYTYLQKEVKVLPDDQITVECTYNSSRRHYPTFGGLSTKEEMCLAFILYYPLFERYGCLTAPTMSLLVGITGSKVNMANLTYGEFYQEMVTLDWSKVNTSLMETAARYAPHLPFCYLGNGDKAPVESYATYPKEYEPYVEEDECTSGKEHTSGMVADDSVSSVANWMFVFLCAVSLCIW